MTTYFEHNLENVKSKLLLMGQLANDSLKLSIQALLEGDSALAKTIRRKDEEIDDLENELSESVTSYLSASFAEEASSSCHLLNHCLVHQS